MASEVKRSRADERVTVEVPGGAPVLVPAVAVELLAVLVDTYRSPAIEREAKRPEAA
jgi:hypothetical protein